MEERRRNKGKTERGARTMVGRGGGGMGDGVVKDGVWIESEGEDRRGEEEEEAAAAGRVSMCKRFLQPGVIEHLRPELWVMSEAGKRENFCPPTPKKKLPKLLRGLWWNPENK